MARQPTVGGDGGNWGSILNTYLGVSLASDGTLNPSVVSDANVASSAAIAKSKLSSSVQTSLSTADTSVQTVNGKSPTSGAVTLAASDVSAATAPTFNTFASFPAASSVPTGTGAFATDLGYQLYVSDGSAWQSAVGPQKGSLLGQTLLTGTSPNFTGFAISTSSTTWQDVTGWTLSISAQPTGTQYAVSAICGVGWQLPSSSGPTIPITIQLRITNTAGTTQRAFDAISLPVMPSGTSGFAFNTLVAESPVLSGTDATTAQALKVQVRIGATVNNTISALQLFAGPDKATVTSTTSSPSPGVLRAVTC
jgi:hypothetical protein